MIVDDSLDVRRMLGISLRMLGPEFDVLEVPSAEEALLIGSRLPFDLIVVDVRLPGMSGLDLLSRIRKRSPSLKVILVTGASDAQTRDDVAEAGADAFFYKPVKMTDFLDTAEKLLGLVKDGFSLPPAAKPAMIQSGRQKPDVRTISETEEPIGTLYGHLSQLHRDLRAVSVVLLDENGGLFAEVGETQDFRNNGALITAIMAAVNASRQVSQKLGMDAAENLMFFTGYEDHFCVLPINAGALVVVSKHPFPDAEIRQMMHKTKYMLMGIVAEMGIKKSPGSQAIMPTQAELAEPGPDAQVAEGVEDLFSSRQGVKEQDVDAFWDALVEQSELDGSENTDALTYDQARQLGIVPEDEG